jgi:hypothetical protein
MQITINLLKPNPWSLFELTQGLQQSTNFVLGIWVVESFGNEHLNYFFKIAIQKHSIDIQM